MAISMTGFGRGEYKDDNYQFLVECKTINHKYADINIRLPRKLSFLEDKARILVKDYIKRGRVDLYIKLDLLGSEDVNLKFDEELATQYVSILKQIKDKFDLVDDISVMNIAKFPDVIKTEEKEDDEDKLWSMLKVALENALLKLKEMRSEEGKKLAERIVKRMRNDLNIKEVPIVVALFKQEPRNSIVPGTYFAVGKADVGKEAVSEWTPINEEYVLFPGDGDKEYHRDMNQTFKKFKQDIDEYFPSFVSVIGRGFYKDGELQSLRVEIPIQFFGTSEVIGFAQHLTALVDKYFTTMQVEVSVTSVNGPEVLIVRKPGDEEPYVHIYNY